MMRGSGCRNTATTSRQGVSICGRVAPVATDRELLDAWRAGDGTAGSELFERHYDALYGFLWNKVPDSVEDLVQKTMLACVEGRDRIESDFVGYMLGAARRLLYREYDRRQREGARFDYGVSSAHDLAPSPSAQLAAHGEEVLLHAALRRIAFDYQVALELHYTQGIRGPQLAAILDVPEGTVRSRLRRGLAQLRVRLGELEASPALAREALTALEAWESELPEDPTSETGT
jgi:RNA polymerase sigma-70 factor (ECF subfamily)